MLLFYKLLFQPLSLQLVLCSQDECPYDFTFSFVRTKGDAIKSINGQLNLDEGNHYIVRRTQCVFIRKDKLFIHDHHRINMFVFNYSYQKNTADDGMHPRCPRKCINTILNNSI